jgi:hypothetical protein
MPDATWQAVLAGELTDQNAGRLADVAMAALERDMPLLREQDDLRELARAAVLANLGLVAAMASGTVALADAEPPPQVVAFARELARRNVPMAELARTYRVVQHAMWRVGVAEIRRRMTDDQAIAAAVEDLTDATFATGEVLMSRALERYSAERDRWVRSADALRRETVEALLDGAAIDADTASARLRYELRRPHVGFVVWADGDDGAPEAAAAALGGPHALVIGLAAGTLAGWCHPDTLDVGALNGAVHAAISTPGDGVDGFRRAHAEALEAQRVARLGDLPSPTHYDDISLVALLTSNADQAKAFAARELGDLQDERIAETVLEVLRAQGSPRRAAQRLGVHENTVAKRVKSAEQQLGRPIDERPAELFAALLIDRLRP